jgi:hypothetical protein
MFSHHILKPERTPLEANIWGTEKSSGAFSTMFRSRVIRALEYASAPFEIRLDSNSVERTASKVYGLSDPMGSTIANDYAQFERSTVPLYLSCGDSSATDIPPGSVDAVITDPPFFDNVHYSQLADFFYVWQRHLLGADGYRREVTTRSSVEVQSSDAAEFTHRLGAVWAETHRVLKDDGILAFTYHHSRAEGWRAVLMALMGASFVITAVHPVKSEMSGAVPKRQAADPIDLDLIIVCRKQRDEPKNLSLPMTLEQIEARAKSQIDRFAAVGRALSRNDTRGILMAQLIRTLSCGTLAHAELVLDIATEHINALTETTMAPS